MLSRRAIIKGGLATAALGGIASTVVTNLISSNSRISGLPFDEDVQGFHTLEAIESAQQLYRELDIPGYVPGMNFHDFSQGSRGLPAVIKNADPIESYDTKTKVKRVFELDSRRYIGFTERTLDGTLLEATLYPEQIFQYLNGQREMADLGDPFLAFVRWNRLADFFGNLEIVYWEESGGGWMKQTLIRDRLSEEDLDSPQQEFEFDVASFTHYPMFRPVNDQYTQESFSQLGYILSNLASFRSVPWPAYSSLITNGVDKTFEGLRFGDTVEEEDLSYTLFDDVDEHSFIEPCNFVVRLDWDLPSWHNQRTVFLVSNDNGVRYVITTDDSADIIVKGGIDGTYMRLFLVDHRKKHCII